MRSNLPITGIEHPVPEGEVLVSKTDLKGVITYCNNTFIEVSGYTREELTGAPHNLLRHPDMPQEAFADLWKTVQANKPWRGIVKNRRKDGSFYWVEANITPLLENGKAIGYVSFRYQATPEQIKQADAAYQAIRAGTSRLRIHEGKVVQFENRLLRWLNASSIKFRLVAFMSVLFSTLIVIGGFNLHESSNAHNLSVNSLEVTRMEAYALDTARTTELDFKEQLQIWKNLLIGGHDAALVERQLKEFDQQGNEFENRLSLLKSIMRQIDLPTESVDAVLESHIKLTEKYRHALRSVDMRRPASGQAVNDMVKGADLATIAQIELIVSTIQEAQQNRLRDLNITLQQSHDTENKRSLVMLAAAALVGLLLSIRFIVSIIRPIHRASSNLKKVVKLQQHFLKIILKLEVYRDRIDEEQRVGNFIMSRMTDMNSQLSSEIRRYTRPAEHLSGDVLIAATTPTNTIHILLADAVGHGLTAAINVLPLCQTFYDLTGKGFSIAQIAADLNGMVKQFMPVDRFVSATLISINRQDQIIEVWNGGIPALQLFARDGRLLQSWGSRNLPLGILPSDMFSAKPEVLRYQEDCQLCLFSDGLTEAASPQGEPFGYQRIVELFGNTTAHDTRFDALIARLDLHLQGQSAHDDISLAIVDIPLGIDQEMLSCHVAPHAVAEKSDDWRIALSLGANELKYLDVVPLLTQIIAKIHVTREHNSALFLILSELFNNALDHGVLRLDSSIKLGSDGFEKFLALREARMQALSKGKIEIEIERVIIAGKQAVMIRVADSGNGFDHTHLQSGEQLEHAQHGRGIALARSLAYRLEYAGNGSEVTAYYICA